MGFRVPKLAYLVAILWLLPLFAQAGVEQLSEKDFRALAEELSHKVNLFKAVWATDPGAEFYGGTSRDYLYWLKGKFQSAKTPKDAEKIAADLRKKEVIDVRSFLMPESDVDVITDRSLHLSADDFGLRKMDTVSPKIFSPDSELWQNEIDQGHIPVEKIRLSNQGVRTIPELGDGLAEIYRGRLTVHFADPEKFAATKFAKEGVNHPILLALRYLRVLAMNYYQENGSGYPDPKKLLSGLDPAARPQIKAIVEEVSDGRTLNKYLANHRFQTWLNGTLQKAFRSYTNTTAALQIMQKFKVDQLPFLYPGKIEKILQYTFAKKRDPAAVKKNLAAYDVDKDKFYLPRKKVFSDGYLYHGTKTEQAFRSIVFQNVLPSTGGNAGEGLYGVATENREFSEDWGGDRNRLLRIPVSDSAKIVDITEGEGKRVWEAYDGSYEQFAEDFNVDILKYPYSPEAFVVKNSLALGRGEGVYRTLMTVDQIQDLARHAATAEDFIQLSSILEFNSLNAAEKAVITKSINEKVNPLILEMAGKVSSDQEFAQIKALMEYTSLSAAEKAAVVESMDKKLKALARELAQKVSSPKGFARVQSIMEVTTFSDREKAAVVETMNEKIRTLALDLAGKVSSVPDLARVQSLMDFTPLDAGEKAAVVKSLNKRLKSLPAKAIPDWNSFSSLSGLISDIFLGEIRTVPDTSFLERGAALVQDQDQLSQFLKLWSRLSPLLNAENFPAEREEKINTLLEKIAAQPSQNERYRFFLRLHDLSGAEGPLGERLREKYLNPVENSLQAQAGSYLRNASPSQFLKSLDHGKLESETFALLDQEIVRRMEKFSDLSLFDSRPVPRQEDKIRTQRLSAMFQKSKLGQSLLKKPSSYEMAIQNIVGALEGGYELNKWMPVNYFAKLVGEAANFPEARTGAGDWIRAHGLGKEDAEFKARALAAIAEDRGRSSEEAKEVIERFKDQPVKWLSTEILIDPHARVNADFSVAVLDQLAARPRGEPSPYWEALKTSSKEGSALDRLLAYSDEAQRAVMRKFISRRPDLAFSASRDWLNAKGLRDHPDSLWLEGDPVEWFSAGDPGTPSPRTLFENLLFENKLDLKDPRTEAWLNVYFEGRSGKKSWDPSYRTLPLKLFVQPEFQRFSRASSWMQEMLQARVFTNEEQKQLREILQQPPWSNHPMSSAWRESLDIPAFDSTQPGHRGEPREDFLRSKESKLGGTDRIALLRERWWRRSFGPPPVGACQKFFRLLGY